MLTVNSKLLVKNNAETMRNACRVAHPLKANTFKMESLKLRRGNKVANDKIRNSIA